MRVLIIEDEIELAALMRRGLGRHGFAVDVAHSVAAFHDTYATAPYDLILLDLMLPDGDGLDILRALRTNSDTVPVLAVTARDTVAERVAGLDCGADDYLVKPFAQEELLARMRALLRRPSGLAAQVAIGNLLFDCSSREVTVAERGVIVPRRELAILEFLVRRANRVVTRDAIENSIYSFDEIVETNTLDVHISRLRKRLADAGAGVVIHGIRGVGYLLKAAEG